MKTTTNGRRPPSARPARTTPRSPNRSRSSSQRFRQQLDADTALARILSRRGAQLPLGDQPRLARRSYELPTEELIEKSARDGLYELLTARSTSKRGETAQQRQERISSSRSATARRRPVHLSQPILAPVALSSATNGWSSSPTARCNTFRLRCCLNRSFEFRVPSFEFKNPTIRNSQSDNSLDRPARSCQLAVGLRVGDSTQRVGRPSARAEDAGGDRRSGL